MQNPYIVGTPVSGKSFYGRRDLLDFLLDKRRSVYLVGLRRSGKTSVLRQLEIESSEAALYLDWQFTGPSPLEMGREVICQYRQRQHQHPQLTEIAFGEDDDVCAAIAKLSHAAVTQRFQVLLLWDEAETLLELDGEYLKRLRGAFVGRPGIRSILTATQALRRLDEVARSWTVSPFLAGFETCYLTPLDDSSAADLIRQSQVASPQVAVNDELVDRIRQLTGNQPYLIQYLCSSLFDAPGQLEPPPTKHDPELDDQLSAILQEDYDRLSSDEQAILCHVLEREIAAESDLAAGPPLALGQLRQHLRILEQLGYLVCRAGRYHISNRFLWQWIKRHNSNLSQLGNTSGPRTSTAPHHIAARESSVPTEIRRRYALLIGVRNYWDPAYRTLPHTVHDVTRLEQVLCQQGYVVRTLHSDQPESLHPTRENIWGELANLVHQTGPGDLLLVHFGGHGDLDSSQTAYLLPENGRKASLARTAIPLDEFKREMASAPTQAKLLLLDACHSGIGRDATGMDAQFEHYVLQQAEGMATLAACRRGQVAWEHDSSPHGAFTFFVLKGLQGAAPCKRPPFVTFGDLNDYVTYAVKDWAIKNGHQQWPNASTQLVGDPTLVRLTGAGGSTHAFADCHPNPFTDTLAIRDAARFVGRQAELRRLRAMLQGGSVALLGEPKIGKSSLLLHLVRTWTDKVIGPLDCMQLDSAVDLYQQLAVALSLTDCDWRSIRAALNASPALVLLDELDAGPAQGLTHADLARFRAVCSANPQLKIVAVSRTPLKALFPDPGLGSPAYNFTMPLMLGPLAEAEAHQLLAHPWSPDAPLFDAATCEQLLALAGGHPFKLQRAAFHRYEALADSAYDWQASYNQDVEQML